MTAYRHKPTCLVPADKQQVVNDYLERQGLGRCFSIPLTPGNSPNVTHYATTLRMTDDMNAMLTRLMKQHGGQRVEKKFAETITGLGLKRKKNGG